MLLGSRAAVIQIQADCINIRRLIETLASLIELMPANKSIKSSRYPRTQQNEARVCSKAFNTDVHVDSHAATHGSGSYLPTKGKRIERKIHLCSLVAVFTPW